MEEQKVYTRCLRCNRTLKNEKAKERGYGEYCYHIHLLETKKPKNTLFSLLTQSKNK